jgi:hypothetical protein
MDDLAAKLHATTDASVWTDEFMKLVKTGIDVDWDLMIGWFANAIETGRATGRSEHIDGDA